MVSATVFGLVIFCQPTVKRRSIFLPALSKIIALNTLLVGGCLHNNDEETFIDATFWLLSPLKTM